MISIVLYGRNDTYGYNLHKRAALSLNCMAEVLTDPDDEILFVDYNTPDDYPTFPEAIEDTLTAKAKKLLRIFRVRPATHTRYEKMTHLKALEPISRNIAIRRSNPSNRWILSTNTDMIFVPQTGSSLTEIVRPLEDGYWAVPRFEIPESLWESFDRMDPVSVIKAADYWGRRAHLNEIVLGCDENLFDAPGDFQLMTRDVLFKVNGFDERMLLGWHVDSNLAKRLNMFYGKTSDLSREIYGYHCDHTKQVTPAHRHKSVGNDMEIFFENVVDPTLVFQEKFGCPDDEIEEIVLGRNSASFRYTEAIEGAIRSGITEPLVSSYRSEGYDRVNYDPDHVAVFLADLFVNFPLKTNVAWFGYRKETLNVFGNTWNSFGFSGEIFLDPFFAKVLLDEREDVCPTQVLERDAALQKADLFVFDFGIWGNTPLYIEKEFRGEDGKCLLERTRNMVEAFFASMEKEYSRVWSGSYGSRRFILINSHFNRFENMVRSNVETARTPFSTRVQQGYLVPKIQSFEEDLLPQVHIGSSGRRESSGEIHVLSDGFVFYGPYLILLSGLYVLEGMAKLSPGKDNFIERDYIEVVRAFTNDHQERVAYTHVDPDILGIARFSLRFDVPSVVFNAKGDLVSHEFRFCSKEGRPFVFQSLKIRRINDTCSGTPFIGEELLPRLSFGDAGMLSEEGFISDRSGKEGYVCFGPYLSLPEGSYRVICTLGILPRKFLDAVKSIKEKIYLEVVAGVLGGTQRPLSSIELSSKRGRTQKISLAFEVREEKSSHDNSLLYEFRLWTNGVCRITLSSIILEKL